MTVELTDDVHWINECFTLENGKHEHTAVYLIRHGDRYVLVDSGSFYHRDAITEQIEAATAGEGPDAIVLSHSDYPHSGNIPAFRERWDDVEVVASSGAPEAQGLPPTATKCEIGGRLEVAGRPFSFIDPPLADRSHTTWIYDEVAEVLFTADGFGNHHTPGECDLTSGEIDGGIAYDDVKAFNEDTLVWLRYVDPGKLRAALEAIFEAYPVSYVAPIHGNPIEGSDVDGYVDRLVEAASDIADEYTVPDA
ncbi:MBL fold metallo-hydrolase [Halobaculum sp. EA56]|uniref:MBL fold metallo-hydrolase n=1 Tax=Halobaculum sp. EA56 TaxID=3421648 RepID=UPI003EBCDDB7